MKNCKGGKVLASGGFGCVFSPALRCKGKTMKKSRKGISKLMKEKYALTEFAEIKKIKERLQHVKNYTDYFLLYNIDICRPSKLTKQDLKNFTNKCTALPKDNITKSNVNEQLDQLMILNMPNGGITVDEFIASKGNLYKLNNSLIKLLVSGIVPMNKNHIYHCDVKETNILVDTKDGGFKTRLIDWGLSTEYIPNKNNKFPATWRNRPLQFNVPFSVIIFTDYFVQSYTKYINDGGKTTSEELRPFVVNYIYYWMRERGSGHYELINEIMYMLFSADLVNIYDDKMKYKLIERNFTIIYITNYIIDILVNFTRFRPDGTLDLRYYLDKVFIKIVDVWGFIITYLPLLENLFENYDSLTQEQLGVFNELKMIYVTYLYNPRVEPINIDKLVKDLNNLGSMFEGTQINNFVTKHVRQTAPKKTHKRSTNNNVTRKTRGKRKNRKIEK